jgi:hypothetical protein
MALTQPSVNCSLDDIDLNSLKVLKVLIFKLKININHIIFKLIVSHLYYYYNYNYTITILSIHKPYASLIPILGVDIILFKFYFINF